MGPSYVVFVRRATLSMWSTNGKVSSSLPMKFGVDETTTSHKRNKTSRHNLHLLALLCRS